MKYAEFTKVLEDAEISLREFARLLKLNPNTLSNYKSRNAVPSHLGVIAHLVRELALRNLDYTLVIKRARVKPKAPRGSTKPMFGKR